MRIQPTGAAATPAAKTNSTVGTSPSASKTSADKDTVQLSNAALKTAGVDRDRDGDAQ